MEHSEKFLSEKILYEGKVINLKILDTELENGERAKREIVEHPGGVLVISIDENKDVLMVKQYRVPFGRMLLEAPAGKLDKGEDTSVAAARELREETGLIADKMVFMGNFYPTVGVCDENLRMYLATGLTQGEDDPDEDEFINVEKIHIDKLVDMIMNNEIKDGKTIAAVLKAKILLDK